MLVKVLAKFLKVLTSFVIDCQNELWYEKIAKKFAAPGSFFIDLSLIYLSVVINRARYQP